MRKVIEKQLKFEQDRSKLESDDGFLLFSRRFAQVNADRFKYKGENGVKF